MNKEHLSQAISDIDEKYIEEAAVSEKKTSHKKKYIAAAACIAVAVLSVTVLAASGIFEPKSPEKSGGTSGEAASDELLRYPENGDLAIGTPEIMTEAVAGDDPWGSGEMAIEPQWSELSLTMKYPEIKKDGVSYHTMDCEIPADSAGELLYSTEMNGYDHYTETSYTVNADIFALKNISTVCAVAARIDGSDKYYVYTDPYYTPETLGDMIKDLDLKNTMSFGKAYSDHSDGTKYTSRTYEDLDDSIVWEMLLSDESIRNVSYDRFYDKIVGISVDIPVLGFKNISLGVTKDGYLVTNIMSTQKCFFIGKEKAEAFGEYLEKNVKYSEDTIVYKNPDGSIPGKEDEGQSTPGYNPDDPQSVPPMPPDYCAPAIPGDADQSVSSPYYDGGSSSSVSGSSSSSPAYYDTVVEATSEGFRP